MTDDFEAAIAEHRPAVLRHCYRMLGSFAEAEDLAQESLEKAWKSRASYRGEAPLKRWLFTIATHACLNALDQRGRFLSLPQLEGEPAGSDFSFGELEPSRFITPAPDARLFPSSEETTETRESVALAFVALLQRVPPKQRATLLMKDVLGWQADEIAEALGLSLPSVNSALHRSRKAVAVQVSRAEEPSPATVRELVRAWETRDIDGLVALLREDIVLAMPPYPMWFRGVEGVLGFLRSARFSAFWSSGVRLALTRANGLPAFVFFKNSRLGNGQLSRHSTMVARFLGGRVAEMTVFVGPSYFSRFENLFPEERSVSGGSPVLNSKGDQS